MKKTLTLAASLLLAGAVAYASQLQTTSQGVLLDTAANAGTGALRDSSGNLSIAQQDIQTSAVVTAKIAASSVITAKLYLDLSSTNAACVTTAKLLGVCSSAPNSSGQCTCN